MREEAASYYDQGGVRCVDFLNLLGCDYLTSSIIRYLTRWPLKGQCEEDLKKLVDCAKMLLRREEKREEPALPVVESAPGQADRGKDRETRHHPERGNHHARKETVLRVNENDKRHHG